MLIARLLSSKSAVTSLSALKLLKASDIVTEHVQILYKYKKFYSFQPLDNVFTPDSSTNELAIKMSFYNNSHSRFWQMISLAKKIPIIFLYRAESAVQYI